MDKLKQKSAHGFSRKVSDLLIEHAPEGIVMLSPDGVVRAVNETFLKMAKRREEDLLGKAALGKSRNKYWLQEVMSNEVVE